MIIRMNAKDFIRSVNFMINLGTKFNYKEEYQKLSIEDKKILDAYFEDKEFTLT